MTHVQRVSHNKCFACNLTPGWLMLVNWLVHCRIFATLMPTPSPQTWYHQFFQPFAETAAQGCSGKDEQRKPALFSEQVLAAPLSVPPSAQHLSQGWAPHLANLVRPCIFRPRQLTILLGRLCCHWDVFLSSSSDRGQTHDSNTT